MMCLHPAFVTCSDRYACNSSQPGDWRFWHVQAFRAWLYLDEFHKSIQVGNWRISEVRSDQYAVMHWPLTLNVLPLFPTQVKSSRKRQNQYCPIECDVIRLHTLVVPFCIFCQSLLSSRKLYYRFRLLSVFPLFVFWNGGFFLFFQERRS